MTMSLSPRVFHICHKMFFTLCIARYLDCIGRGVLLHRQEREYGLFVCVLCSFYSAPSAASSFPVIAKSSSCLAVAGLSLLVSSRGCLFPRHHKVTSSTALTRSPLFLLSRGHLFSRHRGVVSSSCRHGVASFPVITRSEATW